MAIVVGTAEAKPGKLERGELRVGSMADGSPIRAGVHRERPQGRPDRLARRVHPWRGIWRRRLHYRFHARARHRRLARHDRRRAGGQPRLLQCSLPRFLHRRPEPQPHLPRQRRGQSQLPARRASARSRKICGLSDRSHSGGIGAEVPFYVTYKTTAAAAATSKTRQAVVEVIWRVPEAQGMGGTVTAESMRRNIRLSPSNAEAEPSPNSICKIT